MEPVATQGMMGERATAVTYLQGGGRRKRSRELEGCARQARTSGWEGYQSDGWSQISPNLRSCLALQSRALLLTCDCRFREDAIASAHALFLQKTHQGKQKKRAISPAVAAAIPAAGGWGIYLSCCVKVWSRVPWFCRPEHTRLASRGILLFNTSAERFTLHLRRHIWQRFYPPTW